MIKKQILNSIKISENEETNKINTKSMVNTKTSSIQADIEKAKIYDFLPVILKHMKHKQTMDDIYGEYNQYLLNISKSTNNNSNKKNVLGYEYKYPKIKYLFLENIINNLNHMVKFVNIKNNEELEQNVINIIRDEYSKINKDNDMNGINDFLTYGYEYVPKRKAMNIFPILKDTGQQVHESKYINDNNKQSSVFFINEQKFDEIQISNKENINEKISPTKNMYIKQRITSKKKTFDKLKYKGRNQNNELKEDINTILSSYKTYDNKNDIFKAIDKKKIKSLLKNEKLKTLNIFNKISFKKKVKTKPKFIKINLKASKLHEDFKNNSSIKYDSSNKIDETFNPSIFFQKESKENSDEKIDKLDNNNKDSEIKEDKDLNDNEIVKENESKNDNEKEEINEIKNLIINEEKHIIPSEKKESINLNSNIENINNKKQMNEDNKISIDIERLKNLFKNNEINKDNSDTNIKKEDEKNENDGDNEEEKSENSNEKEEDLNSDITEQKEESSDNNNNKKLKETEEKKGEEEIKDRAENLEDDIGQEMKESENENKKNKKLLKKKKTNKFLKSIENTLIALAQIENHAKQNPSKKKSMYNELMPNQKNLNDSNNEEKDIDSNSENKPKKNVQKKIFLKIRTF